MEKKSILYALSVFLKSGDVLHFTGLTKEERDKYFELAKHPSASMVIEERDKIQVVLGSDILNISAKRYDPEYEKFMLPVKKMLLSESSFGTWIYTFLIKCFVAIAAIVVVLSMVTNILGGEVMEIIMDIDALKGFAQQGFDTAMNFFKYTAVAMFIIAVVDIVLGLNAKYHINMDGAPAVRTRRFMGLVITLAFVIGVNIVKAIIF